MPNLMNITDVDAQKTLSNFEFSGKKIDELGASEYTLSSIAVDVSSSVEGFRDDLVKAMTNIVGACEKNPRAENMLIRGTTFCQTLSEIHGFVPLEEIKTKDYEQYINPVGTTALYDATLDGLEATKKYGETLADMDYICNGIVFIVTDGAENASTVANPKKIRDIVAQIKMEEKLESVKSVLVGVGDEGLVRPFLENFQKDAGLDQFVWIGEATPAKLAKLAEFISQSISSQSQSLGSGAASQDITF